jgi:hypothetical protein
MRYMLLNSKVHKAIHGQKYTCTATRIILYASLFICMFICKTKAKSVLQMHKLNASYSQKLCFDGVLHIRIYTTVPMLFKIVSSEFSVNLHSFRTYLYLPDCTQRPTQSEANFYANLDLLYINYAQ